MSEKKPTYRTKEKTIFRVNKNADNPFVMMDKRPIENDNLSWKAKGLLSYLLSRPDDWTVRMADLIKRSTDGEHATRSAIKELMEAKHLVRKQGRTEGAKFDTVTYDVYEEPLCDFPQADKPQADNLALNKIDSNKKELNNTVTPTPSTPEAQEPDIIDTMMHFAEIGEEKEAKGETWPHREKFPEQFWENLDAYVRLTGQKPLKSKVTDWLLTAQDWYDLGIKPDDLHKAYEQANPKKGDGFTVARPGSLTNTAGAFAGKRQVSGEKSYASVGDRIFAELDGKVLQDERST